MDINATSERVMQVHLTLSLNESEAELLLLDLRNLPLYSRSNVADRLAEVLQNQLDPPF